jgi:hypothetical protein
MSNCFGPWKPDRKQRELSDRAFDDSPEQKGCETLNSSVEIEAIVDLPHLVRQIAR